MTSPRGFLGAIAGIIGLPFIKPDMPGRDFYSRADCELPDAFRPGRILADPDDLAVEIARYIDPAMAEDLGRNAARFVDERFLEATRP